MPGIPKENVEKLWHIAEKYLDDGNFDLDKCKKAVLKGDYRLWIGKNGKVAVILEVLEYPKGKKCDIVMLAGEDIKTWIKELDEIEAWASMNGCNRMTLTGRQGWVKMLKDYRVKTVTMVKML